MKEWKISDYDKERDYQNRNLRADCGVDGIGGGVGTEFLQRHEDRHDAVGGMAERRHLRRHPNQDRRIVRRLTEVLTYCLTIKRTILKMRQKNDFLG